MALSNSFLPAMLKKKLSAVCSIDYLSTKAGLDGTCDDHRFDRDWERRLELGSVVSRKNKLLDTCRL